MIWPFQPSKWVKLSVLLIQFKFFDCFELIRVQFYFIFIFLFDPSWSESIRVDPTRTGGPSFVPASRVRYIMLENSSIMLLSVTQKNLVLCPKLCSKNIALCSPDFYRIQHVLITTV